MGSTARKELMMSTRIKCLQSVIRPSSSQCLKRPSYRLFSSKSTVEITPALRAKNALTALILLGCVGGIYYTAIQKMRQTDELSKIVERESK